MTISLFMEQTPAAGRAVLLRGGGRGRDACAREHAQERQRHPNRFSQQELQHVA
jgi:hypothetical protein